MWNVFLSHDVHILDRKLSNSWSHCSDAGPVSGRFGRCAMVSFFVYNIWSDTRPDNSFIIDAGLMAAIASIPGYQLSCERGNSDHEY